MTGLALQRHFSEPSALLWSRDVDRERITPSPPTQTGRAVLPHPAFQFVAADGLAQALDSRLGRSRTSRAGFRPAHLSYRRSTVDRPRAFKPGIPAHPGEQPCGTTRTLLGCLLQICPHHVPTPLRSTVVTRFFATTRALTPTGPFRHRPWFPDSRHQNFPPFCLQPSAVLDQTRSTASTLAALFCSGFALHSQARQNRRPNRVHFLHPCGCRYGLVVHFQLLSTRGYRPDAVTFSYWPFSVGQVRDFHPAVQVRSQAH